MIELSLSPTASLLLAFVALAFCAEAVRRARWDAPLRDHLGWAFATAVVLLAHRMNFTLASGVSLQYLGAAFLALLLGYPRALVSMTIVFAVGPWLPNAAAPAASVALVDVVGAWGLRTLLGAVLPIWTMWLVVSACRRWLPRNLFVFLLGCGLFGVFFACAVQVLATVAITALVAPDLPPGFFEDVVPYALLLASGEAWLEGMLTTLLVVYAPGSVRLFDEAFYLSRR
ncbi:MAG: hypothetical protein RIS35_1173 [Pseudomonadota bacterium]|jgi:uncharacterized membrane protein